MVRKPSMGRQKIEIKKIENIDARQVCFSKRRAGLFKKASELCTLCGAEVAIVVFSPAGKVFSFGHPSVPALVDRFLMRTGAGGALLLPKEPSHAPPDVPHRAAALQDLSRRYSELINRAETEKKRREAAEREMRTARERALGWSAEVDDLGLPELGLLKSALKETRKQVAKRAEELAVLAACPAAFAPPTAFCHRPFKEVRLDHLQIFP